MIQSTRERRLCRRRPPEKKVHVVCRKGSMDLGPDFAVRILDFSEAGVRLITSSVLAAGNEVSITLQGPGNNRPVKRMGCVEWCVPTEGDRFAVGIEFRSRLVYSDLQKLI